LYDASGNGASYAACTSGRAARRSPEATRKPIGRSSVPHDEVAEPPPRRRAGGGAVRQTGVGGADAREALRVLGDQAQAEQPAPVLADQRHVGQVERVEQHRAEPLDVPRVRVVLDGGGLVGPAEADEVGHDAPEAGLDEHRHHPAVEVAPRRLAVQQQHRRAGALVDVRLRRPSEVVAYDGSYGQPGRSAKRSSGVRRTSIRAP
jgi:hypothetical protein